jgi:quinoprotein dehydrogenase-associated probable ABC transporter substrate-binding protein
MNRQWSKAAALMLAGLMVLSTGASAQTAGEQTFGEAIELVDPNVLRVCSDPANMPFSDQAKEGFENKIADLLAEKLGKSVSYTWFPMATGFVRKTLGEHRCDVIIGFAQGDELVQNTNAYYRTAYAIVFKKGDGLDGLDALSDPRLKSKRIGVVAGTPPASNMAQYGLLGRAKPYPLMVDTRIDSPSKRMMKDLADGVIDVAILWGPMAGWQAKQSGLDLAVVPLVKEVGGPRMAYRITMGVRRQDQNWKRQLNTLLRDNQKEIERILLDYGVPLLDERDQPITN